MTRRSSGVLKAVLTLLATGLVPGLSSSSANELIQREIVVLHVKPLNAAPTNPENSPFKLAVDPNRGGNLEFSVFWPGPNERTTVKLKASESIAAGDLRRIRVSAEMVLPDGTRVRSERNLEIREATTALFELFRLEDRPLTVALDARIDTQTILSGKPSAGRPVNLNLEIQHVDHGVVVPLESNRMNTLIGEPVTYRFRLGPGIEAPSVRLTMTPVRIEGQLLELTIDLTGTIPGDIPELVSRREQLIATRGTASTIGLESGEPPSGFRFVVTPLF